MRNNIPLAILNIDIEINGEKKSLDAHFSKPSLSFNRLRAERTRSLPFAPDFRPPNPVT
jgi:hypothetical protein